MFTFPKNDWTDFFQDNIDKLNNIEILISTKKEELKGLSIYPESKDIFRAFDLCTLNDLKVVILGQDCYHGDKQANGLCFSVNNGIKHPPSLRNIIKELKNDLDKEVNSDFSYLAKQGILLLNSSLTVHERLPGSHLHIWEDFTNNVIEYISNNSKHSIIFILWGNYAKKKQKYIDDRHYIIQGSHPSPLSANKGGFFGNKYFSTTNEILKSMGKEPIEW